MIGVINIVAVGMKGVSFGISVEVDMDILVGKGFLVGIGAGIEG